MFELNVFIVSEIKHQFSDSERERERERERVRAYILLILRPVYAVHTKNLQNCKKINK